MELSLHFAIAGAAGTLGRAFARLCDLRGIDCKLLSRSEMDIASPESVEALLQDLKPWAVINAAGFVRVDEAERASERCRRENATGPQTLAAACARNGVPLLSFSSDLVFDGNSRVPYRESCSVSPLNVYGRAKAEAERYVLAIHPGALVVRTSAFFGPWDESNFLHVTLRSLQARQAVKAPSDLVVSPTYVPDLASTCLDLLLDGAVGLIHLSNEGAISWHDWALWAASEFGADRSLVRACEHEELGLPARRPKYSALKSERVDVMPSLENAMARYVQARRG